MSKTVTDTDGQEIEVFSQEEIESQKQAAVEEYKQANPDNKDDLDKALADLKEKEEQLAKLSDKDLNFTKLREQKDAAEKKIDALAKEVDVKIGAAKKEVLEGVMKDHYSETLKGLSGDDAELQKKIEYQYKRLQDSAASKDEVSKKLRDAWVLATRVDDVNITSVISSGGVSRMNVQTNKNFSPEEKAFAQKLAGAGGMKLEDKDFK